MNFLLRLKHWKLFLIVFGFPALSFPATLIGLLMNSDPVYYIGLIGSSSAWVFLVFWLKESGNYLYEQLDTDLTIGSKQKLFNFNLYFVLFYSTLLILYIMVPENDTFNKVYSFAIFPMHLYSMYSLFYAIHFVSKHLSMTEGKSGKFEDFLGYFFMLWFYPIGIWTIQPKINQLINR